MDDKFTLVIHHIHHRCASQLQWAVNAIGLKLGIALHAKWPINKQTL